MVGDQLVSKRVFLSYGHDEHASLAVRIRDDLRKRGHKVWFDEERLLPGHDWNVLTEQGLEDLTADKANSAVILLLTPHAVRRPDGYCLNEVARAVARGLRIIPVMVVDSEPPLSICRIQWLDMRDCIPIGQKEALYRPKFERLLKALEEGQLDFEGTQQHLLAALQPLDFDADILRHAARFTGREWVFKAVDDWLREPAAQRMFWICGGPGSGKTAIAAMLSSRYPEIAALHLCRYGHGQKGDPRRVVSSVAYQLSTQLPDYQSRLARLDLDRLVQDDARTMFDNLIVQPLAGLTAPARAVVILIDALDEAASGERNELASFIATEFGKTPDWLRLIITSRPEDSVRVPLQGLDPFVLDTATEQNRNDIRAFLRRELETFLKSRRDADALVERILEKSEGVFLFAERFCEEVRRGHINLHDPDSFPRGLGGIFHQYFQRLFPDLEKYRKEVRPALRAIIAPRNPLPTDVLQALFKWQAEEFNDFARPLSSVFPISTDAGVEVIRPYHRSLVDWLGNKDSAGPYFVSVADGHRLLADYFERQPPSPRRTSELPWQLAQMKSWQKLYDLLADLDFFEQAWNANQFDLKAYWAQVESGSELRMTEAYRPAIITLEQVGNTNRVGFLGRLLSDAGHPGEALSLWTFLADHFREVADWDNYQASLGNLANIHHDLGDLDGAMKLYREQERICRELDNKAGLLASLGNQALILKIRGYPYDAMKLYKEVELMCRELDNKDGLWRTLGNQAPILKARGDLDDALKLLKEQECICRELGNKDGLRASLGNQALILQVRKALNGAMQLHKEEERICRDIGNKDGLSTSLGNQALILHERGDLAGAMNLYELQEHICRQIGNPEGLATSLANRALMLSQELDRPSEALPLAEEAYLLASEHGYATLAGQVQGILDSIRAKLRKG